MKKQLLTFWIFLIVSCSTLQKSTTIKYSPIKKGKSYYLDITAEFQFTGNKGGDGELEHFYTFSDSSLIYITNFGGTPNYKNIRKQGVYYQLFEALNNGDTLILEGKNKKGNYWKNITINKINLGYKNVNINSKDEFDKILDTFREIKR